MIRRATERDAAAICGIYNHYVLNTTITFEEEAVSVQEMAARIEKNNRDLVWLVDDEGGEIRGYAYATKWRERPAYRYSVETTVYVKHGLHGKGLGRRLCEALVAQLQEKDLRSVIAGIALPNEKSVGLHEALGFEQVAQFKNVGFKFGTWLDVGYWELDLGAN